MARRSTVRAASHRAPVSGLCGWGRCLRQVAEDSAVPLCREHHFRAWYTWQQAEVDTMHARGATQERRAPCEWVYFLRFADRIKIGYTADLRERLRAVPHDEVLHVEPGGRIDERRVHAAFAHLRIRGEWFEAAPDLLAFIDDLHGQSARST